MSSIHLKSGIKEIKPVDYGKVAVLYGGVAAERAISLRSGQAVFNALKESGVDVELIDITQASLRTLGQRHMDIAFIALHGRGGEDGTIQGFLEILGIPYTGSGVMASSIGMDKKTTKDLWRGVKLPTPDYVEIKSEDDLDAVAALGFPVMIKPSHEGSSIGMAKVDDITQLKVAIENAHGYDAEVIAESWIKGEEYTVAILGDEALPAIRLVTPHNFYDFDAKYSSNSTEYRIPCGLSAQDEAEMQSLALKAFKSVHCKGWGRVDFMRDQSGKFWLLEVNTVPGMTDHSLVPMAAKEKGLSFAQLVLQILDMAMPR